MVSLTQKTTGQAAISSTGKVHNPKLDYIEIADSSEKRAKGLMNRQTLCPECAMLFIFEESSVRTFWMENTYIPLDIIFLDQGGKVISISENTEPLNQDKRYSSNFPAKYVLEVNSGFVKTNNLNLGDHFKVQEMIQSGQPYSTQVN
jgi:uncharacterized membrane protein (UPF0127 family)